LVLPVLQSRAHRPIVAGETIDQLLEAHPRLTREAALEAIADPRLRFPGLLSALRDDDRPSFALAELNDLLSGLTSGELSIAVEQADLTGLSPYLQNYVAAMVELAAHRQNVPPPSWVRDVEPLAEPRFATPLAGLRLHLLRAAPVPFKRRNIFIDSSIGDRV
jgi:hypothetical protein